MRAWRDIKIEARKARFHVSAMITVYLLLGLAHVVPCLVPRSSPVSNAGSLLLTEHSVLSTSKVSIL